MKRVWLVIVLSVMTGIGSSLYYEEWINTMGNSADEYRIRSDNKENEEERQGEKDDKNKEGQNDYIKS